MTSESKTVLSASLFNKP